MCPTVTVSTKRYEIAFVVVSRLTSKLQVVDFEIFHRTTLLASPAIALENLAMQSTVCFGWESQAGALGKDSAHDAFCCTSAKNAAFWDCGRNLK
jgi:hypothetical protein